MKVKRNDKIYNYDLKVVQITPNAHYRLKEVAIKENKRIYKTIEFLIDFYYENKKIQHN